MSTTTFGSTDPLLVSLSTLLQSHNSQMILERSPLSPKLLNSAIDRSLSRTKSHEEWANKKLQELQQPATLQRFSCSEMKVSTATDPKIKLNTDPSITSHSRNPTTKLTQNPSALPGSVSTYKTVNTQEPELRNHDEDQTIQSRIPTAYNDGIMWAERTDSNKTAQQLPPAAQRKDNNNHPLQEPNHVTQRKAPTNIQTDGLVGCPLISDYRNFPHPQACNLCIVPSTWYRKTSSNFGKHPRVSNELAMDTEESSSKADVILITMELDDHATEASSPGSIPISTSHELDMDVDTYMPTPKPNLLTQVSKHSPVSES